MASIAQELGSLGISPGRYRAFVRCVVAACVLSVLGRWSFRRVEFFDAWSWGYSIHGLAFTEVGALLLLLLPMWCWGARAGAVATVGGALFLAAQSLTHIFPGAFYLGLMPQLNSFYPLVALVLGLSFAVRDRARAGGQVPLLLAVFAYLLAETMLGIPFADGGAPIVLPRPDSFLASGGAWPAASLTMLLVPALGSLLLLSGTDRSLGHRYLSALGVGFLGAILLVLLLGLGGTLDGEALASLDTPQLTMHVLHHGIRALLFSVPLILYAQQNRESLGASAATSLAAGAWLAPAVGVVKAGLWFLLPSQLVTVLGDYPVSQVVFFPWIYWVLVRAHRRGMIEAAEEQPSAA